MRRRTLLWLAILLWLAAASAAAARWGIDQDRLAHPAWSSWADAATVLFVAAVTTSVLAAVFRTMHAQMRRRRIRAARSVGQLQAAVAIVIVVVLVAVLTSDVSSTLISLGLVGFGLTLALQRPILAIAGWATIFFGGMFREGDRIQVGRLEGDVLAITMFTTRLWEIGAADTRSPGRPTARILTVSNAVFLEEPVANATSDTSIVFDEFAVTVAFEADMDLAKRLLQEVAHKILDPARHEESARQYRRLSKGMRMETYFPDAPVILMEEDTSWMALRLRYLVDARQAGAVRTRLTQAWAATTAAHPDALPPAYPRSQVMRLDEAA